MRFTILCLLAGATVGCARSTPSPEPQKNPPATAAPLAADICKEHGVLEAVCTKCNPKLIAVFQAKGDWCAEHGFPESFCPICHPERGGRPVEAVAADGAPADGTKVRFKAAETAGLAGIETVIVEQRPGGASLPALARLAFDATKRAEINARAAGVVREIDADIGTRVKMGDPLAVVESATVGADQSRLRAAESRVRAAEATYEREQKLVEDGVSSRRDAVSAHTELDAARAELESLRASLGMVGGTGGAGRFTLRAPLAGVVIRRQASIGRLFGPEELLFEVADTSTLWAEIEVPEREAARVELGQAVTFELDAVRGRTFEGRIEYLAPEVDRRTRTVQARATVPNPDGKLRANMFANARIALAADQPTVLVPRTALQRAKGVPLVFVRKGEAEFEARRVKTGFADAESVEVTAGLKAGEVVATEGSFLLKTETLKDSIGAGCSDGD